ncbi:MAG: ion channel [Sphingobacteriaceae bacterium]
MAIFNGKKNNETEIGFGSKNYRDSVRFLNSDGSVNVLRTGLGRLNNIDIYHWLINISLKKFIFIVITFYAAINIFFASIYFYLGADQFGGITSVSAADQYLDLIYFSSQTITTVGYGHVYPVGHLASTIASIQSLLGLMIFAIITGVLFGRFSRPKDALLYSDRILIAPYRDMTGLMFRVANKKQFELIENEAKVVLTIKNPETNKREFYNLTLEIDRINFLALSWTIVHPIDEKSPIFGLSIEELNKRDVEVIILIKGVNDTFSSSVYSRHSYKASQFKEKAKFVPLKQDVDVRGKVIISVSDIHLHESV